MLVEVTVNGYDFTTDQLTYTFYNPPTVHGTWPPYGFADVPTPLNVYGTSFVNSADLAVRFRSLVGGGEDGQGNEESGGGEGKDPNSVDMIVQATFINKGNFTHFYYFFIFDYFD